MQLKVVRTKSALDALGLLSPILRVAPETVTETVAGVAGRSEPGLRYQVVG